MPVLRTNRHRNYPTPPSMMWGFLPILIQLVTIGFGWWKLPPQIPLYYSLPYGFSRLAPKLLIFAIPGLSLLTWATSTALIRLRIQLPIYGHIQFWMMNLALFLFTVSIIHIILMIL